MSFNSRIKERREQLRMSRTELADKIGVTPSAISNYENAISSPKVELLYKLFEALDCDANYLYQDEMKELTYKDKATPEEMENLVKRYRELDEHGKEMVDFTLEKEWERSISNIEINRFPTIEKQNHLIVNAAHSIPGSALEDIQHDENVMNDEDF